MSDDLCATMRPESLSAYAFPGGIAWTVPAMAPWYPAIAGVMLAAAGGGLRQLERSRVRRAPAEAQAVAKDVERLTADA